MAKRTYSSSHISIHSMVPAEVSALDSDIALFGKLMHKASALPEICSASAREGSHGTVPDMRRKENLAFRKAAPVSAFVSLKKKYGVDDHFANSAVNTAKAAVQSVKELNDFNIKEAKAQLADLKKKRTSVKRECTRLSNIKKKFITASRKQKAGKKASYKPGGVRERCNPDGTFTVVHRKGPDEVYPNAYLFELCYLTPRLKQCKRTLAGLDDRKARLEERIKAMKASLPGICFGTKKLQAGRYDKERYPDITVWKQAFQKARSHSLMISGRKDARGGNFRFSYDPLTRTLTYRSQQKDAAGRPVIVSFHGVCFPYGQAHVDAAVCAPKEKRKAVAWRVIRTGGSFRIQCMVDVEADSRLNDDYSTGCIAFDTNVDNLSVAELDGSGNPLKHRIIRFDLSHVSSGHSKQVLSKALDQVLAWCDRSHKPLAMEDLKLKHVTNRYGNKKKNRASSRFAFAAVTELAESKALRHSVMVTKVNPAYTSQAGKLLYMKKYGLSIHEAASCTIGRRALGIEERLPAKFRKMLKKEEQMHPRPKQWKAAYSVTSKILISDMYTFAFA